MRLKKVKLNCLSLILIFCIGFSGCTNPTINEDTEKVEKVEEAEIETVLASIKTS